MAVTTVDLKLRNLIKFKSEKCCCLISISPIVVSSSFHCHGSCIHAADDFDFLFA